jgi:hypothetical protein
VRRWLITGERDWTDRSLVDLFLMRLVERFEDQLSLVHGACPTGVDYFVDLFCERYNLKPERFPVDHKIDGPWPGAGPRRNGRMCRSGQFEGGNAFWSGKRSRSGTLIPTPVSRSTAMSSAP